MFVSLSSQFIPFKFQSTNCVKQLLWRFFKSLTQCLYITKRKKKICQIYKKIFLNFCYMKGKTTKIRTNMRNCAEILTEYERVSSSSSSTNWLGSFDHSST